MLQRELRRGESCFFFPKGVEKEDGSREIARKKSFANLFGSVFFFLKL